MHAKGILVIVLDFRTNSQKHISEFPSVISEDRSRFACKVEGEAMSYQDDP